MDSFLRLYALYKSITRLAIARMIYGNASRYWKMLLWGSKALFVFFAVAQFVCVYSEACFAAMVGSACLWAWAFHRSRQSAFAEQHRLYSERIKYFERDYQYIRYLFFKQQLSVGTYRGDVSDALTFLDEQISTDSQTSISSHPLVAFILAAMLAVLGGAAGSWSARYAVGAILFLLVVWYFATMLLGTLRTKQSDLKEFKRFLLWARSDSFLG